MSDPLSDQTDEPKGINEASEKYPSALRGVLESTHDGILIVDREGKVEIFNQIFLEMWHLGETIRAGTDSREVLLHVLEQVVDPEDSFAKIKELQHHPDAESHNVFQLKDGRVFEGLSKPQSLGKEWVGRVWSFRDVTQQELAQSELRESERTYRSLLKNIPGVVFRGHKDWSAEFFDNKIESLTGYNMHEFNSGRMKWSDIIVEDDVQVVREAFLKSLKAGKPYTREYRIKTRSGGILWVLERGQIITGPQGQVEYIDGVVFDITEQKLALEALRESEEQHRTVLEAAPDPVAVYDMDGSATYINPAFTRVFGWTIEEDKFMFKEFVPKDTVEDAHLIVQKIERGGGFSGIQTERLTKSGERIQVSISGAPFFDRSGRPRGTVITYQDITERRRTEQEIAYIAYHDVLTGLPNRKSFYERIEEVLNQYPRREGATAWALLFLDLDKFKYVNDTLGHTIGDELLKAVAFRLQRSVRRSDFVFRLGGDEFTIIVTNLSKGINVAKVAQKIREQLAKPLYVEGHEIHMTASIGISVYPTDGQTVETLVRNADLAMYAAKEERVGYRFYAEEMNLRALERMKLESSLRNALSRNQLLIYYQPLVEHSSRVIGVEALLRWLHPEWGLVVPSQFIALAEETGAIIPIGKWVLRSACHRLSKWHGMGHKHLYVAVNLSARQFRDPDLMESIEEALKESGLPPASLKLELTESCVVENPEEAIARMNTLREMGVRFSIDDFGTGYSSLSYLKRLPIESLKIDRSFISDSATNREDREIIKTIVSMAQNLNIQTIAEGVETTEQRAFLKDQGCYMMQGFLFGRPMPEEDVESILNGSSGEDGRGNLLIWVREDPEGSQK